jgi:PmbA protein
MPEATELLEVATRAVELAKSRGAQHARAWMGRSREVELRLRDGEIEKLQESTSRSLSLELFVDGRYSSNRTNALDSSSLQAFVENAVGLTRALQADPHRGLPRAEERGTKPAELELFDASLEAQLTLERMEALCRSSDKVLRSGTKVISATSTASFSEEAAAVAMSDGFGASWRQTGAWLGAELTLDDGQGRPEEWDWRGGNFYVDLPDPEALAKAADERARARLGSKKGPNRRGRLIVEPRAAGHLIGHLLRGAQGEMVQQGRSALAGRLGQKLFSEHLTIIDDPSLPRGLASRPVDGEGRYMQRLPLIEGGVLRNYYSSTYYSRKGNLPLTRGDASNRLIARGSQDLAGILAREKEAVLVTSWLGGNSDTPTGDFSFGLRGHLVSGGQVGEPVGEMNLSGNLLQLFSNLSATGNDPFLYSSTQAPTLVFDDVQLSGV